MKKMKMLTCACLILAAGCDDTHAFPSVLAVDPNFDARQVELIIDAVEEWERATDGVVDINVIVSDRDSGHRIKSVSGDHPKLVDPARDAWASIIDANGQCDPDVIIVSVDKAYDNRTSYGAGDGAFQAIIMHELGHHFCFERHTPIETMSVMNDASRLTCVTDYDVERFCNRYNCDGHNVASTCEEEDVAAWEAWAEWIRPIREAEKK